MIRDQAIRNAPPRLLLEVLRSFAGPARSALPVALSRVALSLIIAGVGTSSLTFADVWQHDQASNYFPEFAGRVVYLSDVLLAAGILIWALVRVFRHGLTMRLGPVYVWVPLLVLTVLSFVSALWAIDHSLALWTASRRLLLLAMYLVIVNEARSASRAAAIVVIGLGVGHSLVALGQVYQHSALGLGFLGELRPGAFNYDLIGSPRGYGLGFNPNPTGVIIGVSGLVTYGLLILRRNGWLTIALLVLVLLVMLGGIGATGSRSAMLGVGLGGGLLTLAALRSAKIRLSQLPTLAGHAALVLVIVGGAFVIVTSGNGSTGALELDRFAPDALAAGFATRNADLSLSYPIIGSNAGIGVGAGNYPLALKEEIAGGAVAPKLTPIHNVPVLLLAELGVVGLVAWVVLAAGPAVWATVSLTRGRWLSWRCHLWLAPLSLMLLESTLDFTPWATQDGRVLFIAVVALWAGATTTGKRGVAGTARAVARGTPSLDRPPVLSDPSIGRSEGGDS